MCTAPCDAAPECGALAENASCQPIPSTCGDAAPPAQRCDVECMADADCAGISPDHRCMDGACRAPALSVEDMSMDVSDGDAADVGPCIDDSQCAAGENCVDGACIGPMTCTSNADCPIDTECIDGVCDGSGFACLGCGPGTVCIDGQCLAVCASDAECAAGEVCIAGDCVTGCPAPGATCDMACVDLTRNVEHCGGCNTACPPETRCDGGTCVADFCMTDSDCAAGQACLQGSCGVACAADTVLLSESWGALLTVTSVVPEDKGVVSVLSMVAVL